MFFQVDENDLLQEGLGEYLATENSPPRTEICATGVAGTPIVGNSAQVFGTARLNTEPRLTFVFPSMRSAFDQQEDASELSSVSWCFPCNILLYFFLCVKIRTLTAAFGLGFL